ncbi:cyclic pyranopterin monophosphate synthase subunit MoaA [Candidatus Electrothrix marina]|uniref:GTP 3',8-cyclase n=2 Tax=Candidatus Electrothrix marina TaxID=1859130 RepID=A0A444JD64_9BACT|nr:cyclic pyranopterin monophosphate synthase subunit MoaA [Candidatus Electrothrix marina]
MQARKNSVPHVDPSDSTELKDLFSRTVSYLRLSLTDRCNLKCLYCVPEKDRSQCSPRLDHNDLLSYEELLRVVRVAVSMGISKLRLTGGEPLVRRDIMHFIDQLAEIDNLNDIRITTNGVLLEKFADPLVAAGIRKINISLDTLKPERFERITGVDCFTQVWRGIERAQAVGFFPIKLNTVVMRGINDDELGDFVRMSQETAMQIRFIEFMPIGSSSSWDKKVYMSSDEIMDRIREMGELIPVSKGRADGPATMFRVGQGAKGKIGFISPISHRFCEHCNRLRLTSEGMLRSCLLDDRETDLRSVLRRGGSEQDIQQALVAAVRDKPKGHQMEERLKNQGENCHGRMSRIGG